MIQSRVVVVEDEPAIAETIQYALETDGFTTVWLQEGMPLLSLLAREQVDLVILDIGLPDINGIDLCKKVRRDSSVPVIFLTARSDEIDRVVGLEIGGDDYVVKPFSPRELAARVKAVLRRIDSNDRKQGVRAGKKWFEVDRERRVICYCGTGLDLSRYEYNLLLVFIENPGRVFSRDQLMEQAWDEPDASMDRTIDAHIKNIRSKLKKIKPDRDPILTHRGVGYSLREG